MTELTAPTSDAGLDPLRRCRPFVLATLAIGTIVATGTISQAIDRLRGTPTLVVDTIGYLTAGFVSVAYARSCGVDTRRVFGHGPDSKMVAGAVLTGIAGAIVSLAIGVVLLLIALLVAPDVTREFLRSPAPVAHDAKRFVLEVGIAPAVEELIFRALLFQICAARRGFRSAVITTSLVFGCLHVNLVGAAIFSALLCVIYVRSGSLLVPIIAHAVSNALAWILPVLGGLGPSTAPAREDPLVAAAWMVAITLPTAIALCIALARRFGDLDKCRLPYDVVSTASMRPAAT